MNTSSLSGTQMQPLLSPMRKLRLRLFTCLWLLACVPAVAPQLRAQAKSDAAAPDASSSAQPLPSLPAATAAELFTQLAAFNPLPASELRREIKHTFWTNRVRLALNFGALIGDGFLVVQAQDRARVAPLGRELLRRSRSLGVGAALTARAQRLEELGEAGRWSELRLELIKAQTDVEAALTALRDEDLAMFVRLGGWLRGVETVGAATAERYSPERAAALARPAIIRDFLGRLERLSPALKENLVVGLTAGLREILAALDKPAGEPVSAAEARRVWEIAKRLNADIAKPDDA